MGEKSPRGWLAGLLSQRASAAGDAGATQRVPGRAPTGRSPARRFPVATLVRREGERGAGLVEFALLSQLLVVLLVGVLEFGRVLDAWVVVTNAAREGARYGMAGASTTTIQQKAYEYLAGSLQAVRGDIVMPAQGEIVVSGAGNTGHGPVQVTVPARVRLFTPMVAAMLPQNPVIVRGSATMRAQ